MGDKKVTAELSYVDGNGNNTIIFPTTRSSVVVSSKGNDIESFIAEKDSENVAWIDGGYFDDTIVGDYDIKEMVVADFEKMTVKEIEAR